MTILRRFLVLSAFAFWQGGFTFYAAVAVPIGRSVDTEFQAIVTTAATNYLNIIGAVALVVLAWDLLPVDPASWRRHGRFVLWGVMLLMLAALIGLHFQLTQLSHEEPLFKPLHRLYLWASTVQWGAGLGYLLLTVLAWRAQDRLWK